MSKRILYLEDDEALAYVMCRSLEKLGFATHYFADIASLQTALDGMHFDYVLLDLKIGNETSLGLIEEIKSYRDVPVLVMSGYGTIRTAVQAMKLGAVNFLSKPCGIDDILQALTQEDSAIANVLEIDVAKPSLKAVEWETIQKALDENDGNISAAARQLKMHRRTLQRKLQKRNIQ